MMKVMSQHYIISQAEGNLVSDMDGEKVMLSIENGKYYNLGEVGGYIWEQLKFPLTFQKLVSHLIEQFDVDRIQCEEQVTTFLQQLLEDGLIHIDRPEE